MLDKHIHCTHNSAVEHGRLCSVHPTSLLQHRDGKMQTATKISMIQITGLRRGDAMNGGRFVGKTPRSSTWICYEPGDIAFARMCAAFDNLYGPPARQFAAVA
jgi:hypothetical protein